MNIRNSADFSTNTDRLHLPTRLEDQARAALQLNPDAGTPELVAAALARAGDVQATLGTLADLLELQADGQQQELARTLGGLATRLEEAQQLGAEALVRLARAADPGLRSLPAAA
jgi:hypothetical protein